MMTPRFTFFCAMMGFTFIGNQIIPGLGAFPVLGLIAVVSGWRYGLLGLSFLMVYMTPSLITSYYQTEAIMSGMFQTATRISPVTLSQFPLWNPFDYLLLVSVAFLYMISVSCLVERHELKPYLKVIRKIIK